MALHVACLCLFVNGERETGQWGELLQFILLPIWYYRRANIFVYLMTLCVSEITQRRNVESLMKRDLEKACLKRWWLNLCIHLQGWRKTTINFSLYSRCSMRDSKQAPLSYKLELLQLQLTSVLFVTDKLTNGLSECRFIWCVSLRVCVGRKDRTANCTAR